MKFYNVNYKNRIYNVFACSTSDALHVLSIKLNKSIDDIQTNFVCVCVQL